MFDPKRMPAISAVEAHRRLTAVDDVSPPLLIDVREPNELTEVRAEGIVAMPLSTFMQRHRELPTDRPLLMICQSGARSGQATAFLLGNGWTDVTNVAGGTLSWVQAGLPVRSGALETAEGEVPG